VIKSLVDWKFQGQVNQHIFKQSMQLTLD